MDKNLFMIMCHKNLSQVLLLAKTLLSSESDVVVHIDTAVDDNEYASFLDATKNIPNLYVTDKRLHGVLDTRTLVDIVFLMIEYTKSKGLTYKNYCLMSGQDFPIKSISKINENLLKNYPTPYIDCTPYDKRNWVFHKFKSTPSLIRFNKYISEKFKRKSLIRKLLRTSAIVAQKGVQALKKTAYDHLSKNGIKLYGGSAWWILPDIAINFIYNEYVNSSAIVESLLETLTPEETFFQTMTMLSPCKNDVEINPIDKVDQNCKTWAYFSDTDKPFKGHPYIFTVNEFDKLKASPCWFARKFDIQQDCKIIEMVQNNLIVEE